MAQSDPKWYQIFILDLIWPNEPFFMEVHGKLYYFEGVVQPTFSSLAQNKCNKDQN